MNLPLEINLIQIPPIHTDFAHYFIIIIYYIANEKKVLCVSNEMGGRLET